MILNLLFTLLLVGINGFFVAAEFAIVKVRASQLELKAQAGNGAARLATTMLTHLDGYLAATQFRITLASLGLGWIGEPVVAEILTAGFDLVGLSLSAETTHPISLPVAFALITMLHIVFGELAPKSLAIQRSEGTTLLIAYPLQGFYMVFRPFIWLLNGLANAILKVFGIEASHGNEVHSPDELKYLVRQSQEESELSAPPMTSSDLRIVERAFDFLDRTVRQIMVPRTQIFGVNINAFDDAALARILTEHYSRILCYADDLDPLLHRQSDYESLAGLVLSRFGRLPAKGEKTTIDGYEVTVLTKQGNAIERVQLWDLSPD